MRKIDVIRAWKDQSYFASLSAADQSALPASPAGLLEVRDEDLNGIAGGSAVSFAECSRPVITCSNHEWCE